MKTKTKPITLTAHITKNDLRRGFPNRLNGCLCPASLAITRALKKVPGGWHHHWISWADAVIWRGNGVMPEDAKTALIEEKDRRGYLRACSVASTLPQAKPFTLHLTYK